MKKLIMDLLKAMVNATLLLLLLCLFFGWQLMGRVNQVTDQVTEAVAEVAPLKTRVEALRGELVGLRSDLQNGTQPAAPQLDGIEARLDYISEELTRLRALPATIVQQAAESAAAELSGQIIHLTSCAAS